MKSAWDKRSFELTFPRTQQRRRQRADSITSEVTRESSDCCNPTVAIAMSLEALRYRRGSLQILNQLLLPHQTLYEEISSVRQGWEAVRSMKVLPVGGGGGGAVGQDRNCRVQLKSVARVPFVSLESMVIGITAT